VGDVNQTLDINAANNALFTTSPLSGLGDAATVCPSAFSVQILNPQALQTTSGIVYAGVMNTQAAIAGRTETWDSYADKFVQFQAPRLMSAGKLALRGVQIDSYPLNMSEVSNFTPIRKVGDNVGTYTVGSAETRGWAPIIIYNTGAGGPAGLELELLITTEWRVRFDLDNPAAASHSIHPVATDSAWDKMMRYKASLGHGVQDISDLVATAGTALRVGRAVAQMIV